MRNRTEGPICVVGPSDFLGEVGKALPCGGHGFAKLRDDAELLHKPQSVPVDPAFHHLAVSEAGNAYSRDGEVLSRRSNPAEITPMGTPTGPTGHYGFAFGYDVLDRQSKVGERSAVESGSLLLTLSGLPQHRASKGHGECNSGQRARLPPADCSCSKLHRTNNGRHFCLLLTLGMFSF